MLLGVTQERGVQQQTVRGNFIENFIVPGGLRLFVRIGYSLFDERTAEQRFAAEKD